MEIKTENEPKIESSCVKEENVEKINNKDELDITGTDKNEIEEKMKQDTPAKPLYKNPRWHLVCSTIEEWQEVADSLKYSTTKEAKELYKYIVNDFLPEMPAIMDARVSNSCSCFVALVSYQKCNIIRCLLYHFLLLFFLVIQHLATFCLGSCHQTFHLSLTLQSNTGQLSILTNETTAHGLYFVLIHYR